MNSKKDDFPDMEPSKVVKEMTKSKSEYKGRAKYSLVDDHHIISYVMGGSQYKLIGGNVVWRDMEVLRVTDHSAQSMKDRFRRIILPNISSYNIVPEWITILQKWQRHKGYCVPTHARYKPSLPVYTKPPPLLPKTAKRPASRRSNGEVDQIPPSSSSGITSITSPKRNALYSKCLGRDAGSEISRDVAHDDAARGSNDRMVPKSPGSVRRPQPSEGEGVNSASGNGNTRQSGCDSKNSRSEDNNTAGKDNKTGGEDTKMVGKDKTGGEGTKMVGKDKTGGEGTKMVGKDKTGGEGTKTVGKDKTGGEGTKTGGQDKTGGEGTKTVGKDKTGGEGTKTGGNVTKTGVENSNLTSQCLVDVINDSDEREDDEITESVVHVRRRKGTSDKKVTCNGQLSSDRLTDDELDRLSEHDTIDTTLNHSSESSFMVAGSDDYASEDELDDQLRKIARNASKRRVFGDAKSDSSRKSESSSPNRKSPRSASKSGDRSPTRRSDRRKSRVIASSSDSSPEASRSLLPCKSLDARMTSSRHSKSSNRKLSATSETSDDDGNQSTCELTSRGRLKSGEATSRRVSTKDRASPRESAKLDRKTGRQDDQACSADGGHSTIDKSTEQVRSIGEKSSKKTIKLRQTPRLDAPIEDVEKSAEKRKSTSSSTGGSRMKFLISESQSLSDDGDNSQEDDGNDRECGVMMAEDVQRGLPILKKIQNDFGLTLDEAYDVLWNCHGNVKDASHWVEYGTLRNEEMAWNHRDDKLLYKDPDSVDALRRKYGDASVERRLRFLNESVQ